MLPINLKIVINMCRMKTGWHILSIVFVRTIIILWAKNRKHIRQANRKLLCLFDCTFSALKFCRYYQATNGLTFFFAKWRFCKTAKYKKHVGVTLDYKLSFCWFSRSRPSHTAAGPWRTKYAFLELWLRYS